MSTSVTTLPEKPPARAPRRFLSFSNRYLSLTLVTLILVGAHWSFGLLEGYGQTLLSIVSSMLTEAILGRLLLGRWPNLASAYMTGISVGVLIRSPYYWPYAVCSMLSITSKYAIRWRGRHIFNPSNLGVCALFFLAPDTVASLSIQWSNSLWPMFLIWFLGLWVCWRVRRLHITATYVASFLVFSAIRSAITGNSYVAEVAPLTGPMYQLFIFFMLTDPKTNLRTRWGRCLVAFLVAFVEMIIRLMGDVHAPYYALFLVGSTAYVIEIWWEARQEAGYPAQALAQPAS